MSCIGVLVKAHEALVDPAPLGASALKALGAAAQGSIEMLARLGVIDFVEANLERPTELIIREMTAEEAADIRRQAEAADAGDGSSTDAEADASPQAMPDAGGS